MALGNGAPDVAATMNATLDSQEGYLMALGELTGTIMFVSGVILGVIVSLNDDLGGGGVWYRVKEEVSSDHYIIIYYAHDMNMTINCDPNLAGCTET